MLEGRLDFRAVKTPVQSDTIRKVRNLVHPARYLKERAGEYTPEELRTLMTLRKRPVGRVRI
jgi:hypothetical protein